MFIKPVAIILWLQGSCVHRIKLQNNRKGFAIQNGIKIIIIIMAICGLIATVLCCMQCTHVAPSGGNNNKQQSPAFDSAKTLISLPFALPVVNFVEKFLLAIEIQLKTIKNVKKYFELALKVFDFSHLQRVCRQFYAKDV